ncbi:cadherin EGF LAG seven-pass G-type receptor 3-like, partial [Genypterus blacodes]|uniref:cadherin EGF LAG seven-pass G-type receptor 3-like n=1 Tax=Genypterus blacodes TaxID=154954 RepID=UPI003F7636E8
MAAPLPGFTPLLLSPLVLHLLLLGSLFGLTPGTVTTGGASYSWTPGLCYRDAGKLSQQKQQQQQHGGTGRPARGSWNLRPSRWTVERIQTEECTGGGRRVWDCGAPGADHRDGARGARLLRLIGAGPFWGSGVCFPPPPPSPPASPGSRSRSRLSSDGVGAGEGVERGRRRKKRKGVVSPLSDALTSSPVPNGPNRSVQRTRAWPVSRPHLTGAFVRTSGLRRAPGSGARGGGEVRERAREVRRPLAARCPPTAGHLRRSSPAKRDPSPDPLHACSACCSHSGYNLLQVSSLRPSLTSNSRYNSDLDHICDPRFMTGHFLTHPQAFVRAGADGGSAGHGGADCSHLGRHSVIDPISDREGGDDSCLRSRQQRRETRRGGDDGEEEEEEAHRCRAPAGTCLGPLFRSEEEGNGPLRARVKDRERRRQERGEGRKGGGDGRNQGNKHIHLRNYPDNDLAFLSLTRQCETEHEARQSAQGRAESGEGPGALGRTEMVEMGVGYSAEFTAPVGDEAPRNLSIQFPRSSRSSSSSGAPGQHFLSNKSAFPELTSSHSDPLLLPPTQTQTGGDAEAAQLSTKLAEEVHTRAGDSGSLTAAPLPGKSPGVLSAAATGLGLVTHPDHITAQLNLSIFPEMNLVTHRDDARPLSSAEEVISAPGARWTAPLELHAHSSRVFGSKYNVNSNNNNNNNGEEGNEEVREYKHDSETDNLSQHGQKQQQAPWERDLIHAGCPDSLSTDCSATPKGDPAHMQLKSGKQVPLEPEGGSRSDWWQMGAEGERERDPEREGEGLEGSAAVAASVGGGELQVGEGEREARLVGRREPGGKGDGEEGWERREGITKAKRVEEREAEGGKGQERAGRNTSTAQPESKAWRRRARGADESVEGGEGAERGEVEEETRSSRGERSLERLIVVADDEAWQGEREREALMPWARSRRAANRHPHFSLYNYQVQVAENQPPGTSVIIMSASDQDGGDAGRVSYSMSPLMNSRSSDYFHIHPDTGLISASQILDREHMDMHYFRVTATDFGSPRLSGTTMVAITVSDRNDHSPIFEQTEYRETIRENVEEGYLILQLRATDLDSPANANIRYRFIGDSAVVARAAFEIDPRSGLITTRGSVDREMNEHYTLQVEASDQGKEPGPRSATVKVFITVLDENDNVPQFSEKRYVVAVREDVRPHSEILRVSATDRDKDGNAAVHYNIISGNSRGQFSIDSVTGEIQVVAPLDFESEREYTLRVRAQDNGRPPLSNNTGIVSVQVTDVNDNPPIFVSTPFQASVLESAPVGSSILHIQAIDTDSGDNARLEYRLTGINSETPFIINSATGWVTVRSALDRESVEHYFFGAEARDYGMPPLSATASVTITVMDVNDNRPEFLQKEYYSRLNEDATVGTSVVTVTAVDRDVNSAVTYQITGGNTRNRFAISTAGGSGLLSLALPLDYKQERRYVLTVTASDRTLHDTCQVHINITDANTHRPVFQSAHYSVSVNEDRPPGSTVVVIGATDDDVGENARITYFLEDNIPQFRIDPSTGAITLQAELDYEDQMTYTLAITAKDNGIPQKADTTYVEVNVNDVNDNAPQFLSPRYQGTVSEDAPPFTSVLQISATDRDAHANGRVQYTFQNGEDGDGDFTIEPTSGIVRTVRRLDRESVPFYELTAYAVDRGLPPQRTPVHIQVTVLDVNDNAPVFPADDFEVLVKENSAVGSVVAQITASDPDEGVNAQIMYQIVEGNIPEIFQMDIFSGELTSLIDLDYEARNEYVIVVQATSAPLVSRATVRMKLVDQNDNWPTLQEFQIIFNNFVSNRSNSFPSGVIGRVPAHDPDVSDRLYYTIDSGNELHLLLLNHTSGEIRLSRKLDNNRPLVAPMMISVT